MYTRGCAKPRATTENGKYVHCDVGVCSEKAACACCISMCTVAMRCALQKPRVLCCISMCDVLPRRCTLQKPRVPAVYLCALCPGDVRFKSHVCLLHIPVHCDVGVCSEKSRVCCVAYLYALCLGFVLCRAVRLRNSRATRAEYFARILAKGR